MGIIDLKKKAGIVLAKKQVHHIRARLGFAVDVSGSMRDEFEDGTMQAVSDRFLGLALNLDDNGEMDMWSFDNATTALPTATAATIAGYMRREILQASIRKWGGTEYAPALRAAREHWFPAARGPAMAGGFLGLFRRPVDAGVSAAEAASLAAQPAVLLFLTDGDAQDAAAADAALRAAQGVPLYVNFVGVGVQTDFAFIRDVAERYPNVGFVSVRDPAGMSDEAIYEGVVTDELAQWLRRFATA